MVLTISDEMSVKRLVIPRSRTVRLTRGHDHRDAPAFVRALSTWPEFSIWYTGNSCAERKVRSVASRTIANGKNGAAD
jgi:hypothetical protein